MRMVCYIITQYICFIHLIFTFAASVIFIGAVVTSQNAVVMGQIIENGRGVKVTVYLILISLVSATICRLLNYKEEK